MVDQCRKQGCGNWCIAPLATRLALLVKEKTHCYSSSLFRNTLPLCCKIHCYSLPWLKFASLKFWFAYQGLVRAMGLVLLINIGVGYATSMSLVVHFFWLK